MHRESFTKIWHAIFLKIRKKNAETLSKLISDLDLGLPSEQKNENLNWYLYTIALKNRNKILKKLNEKGIGAVSYYSTPVHKTPYYKLNLKLPNTDWAASHVLSLPVHPKVTHKDIDFISKIMHDIVWMLLVRQ